MTDPSLLLTVTLVIPISDAHSTRYAPIVTYALMALQVAGFAYQQTLPADALDALIERHGLVPVELAALHDPDALLRPFSSLFLHGSAAHLIFNLWCLWIFARTIEDLLGHLRFLVFYLAVASCAGAVQVLVEPLSITPMIGSSGAVAGVLAAYLRLSPRGRVRSAFPLLFVFVQEVSAAVFIALWFVLQLAGGFASLTGPAAAGVAFFATVGGFTFGLCFGPVLRPARNATLGFRRPEFY